MKIDEKIEQNEGSFLVLPNNDEKCWHEWAAWDKTQHDDDMPTFEKNDENQDQDVGKGATAATKDATVTSGTDDGEMHIPKKHWGGPGTFDSWLTIIRLVQQITGDGCA